MTMINMNYDPYGLSSGIRHRSNGDIYLIERRINERFLEFAREMEELKQVLGDVMNNSLSSDNYIEKFYNKTIETDTKINSEKNTKSSKTTKKDKKPKKEQQNSQFKVKTNYNKESKEYEVEIGLPNDFNMDNVNVTLKNSILRIKIEKESTKEDKNSSYYNYGSFYQSFTIPKTKATTKDIIKKLEDDKLEIKVPIK